MRNPFSPPTTKDNDTQQSEKEEKEEEEELQEYTDFNLTLADFDESSSSEGNENNHNQSPISSPSSTTSSLSNHSNIELTTTPNHNSKLSRLPTLRMGDFGFITGNNRKRKYISNTNSKKQEFYRWFQWRKKIFFSSLFFVTGEVPAPSFRASLDVEEPARHMVRRGHLKNDPFLAA